MVTQTQAKSATAHFGIPTTDLTMMFVVLIWGANFSVVKIALEQFSPLAFTAIRFIIGGIVMLVVTRWLEGPLRVTRAQFWRLLWVGVVGISLYQVLFTYALKYTTAANGALIIATVPVWVAFFGSLFGIERLNRNIVIGIVLALAGVVFVLSTEGLSLADNSRIGDLIMLGGALCWTVYTLGVRSMSGTNLSPLQITTLTALTGIPGLLVLSLRDLTQITWTTITPSGWLGLGYSTFLALVVAFVLWNNSVRVAGSNRTAIYSCAIPLIAALVAWPLLGEQPTALQGVGAVFIIAGVLVSRRGAGKREQK